MPEQGIARYKYIFDEILRMTDDGFIVVDRDGIVTDINDQYCDFLGKPREEIVGYPIQKTISNSKMVDIVNRRYREELALHKFLPGESKENDNNFLLVSRSCVCDSEDRAVAGVAQVKFRLQTLDSAKRLMSEYAELEFYKEEYRKAGNCKISFDSIVGTSEAFLEKKRLGLKAAWTDFAVLLTGETGTGKELFARAIHNASNRADKPMVSINCAAIPSELLESELFGYADGAFTGARKGGKPGKFQLANGGTLFLDEIGDMPLNMQAKILRTLQESEVEPVGDPALFLWMCGSSPPQDKTFPSSSSQAISVKTSIIASTSSTSKYLLYVNAGEIFWICPTIFSLSSTRNFSVQPFSPRR